MRVLHVNHTDLEGGAAIAAHRLVQAQREAGIDARMLVLHKHGTDEWVDRAFARFVRLRVRAARAVTKRICHMTAGPEPRALRTLGAVPSGLGAEIRGRAPDIVHWHFVGAETISLAELAHQPMPAVWTCHDQWVFCGAEHYAPDRAFSEGYTQRSALDPDGITFRRKRQAWTGWSPALICPSNWMAAELSASQLLQDCRREVIPNTLDFSLFRPHDQVQARAALGMPLDGPIALFGAFGGRSDPRKGFDLLREALQLLPPAVRAGLSLATFGDADTRSDELAGMKVIPLGRINDTARLAAAYSAADAFIAPSRQDNLPNTMIESLACGTPCVAFDVGGMRDIVAGAMQGALAPAFDVAALSKCIAGQLGSTDQGSRQARHLDTASRFGPETVIEAHRKLYLDMLSEHGPRA